MLNAVRPFVAPSLSILLFLDKSLVEIRLEVSEKQKGPSSRVGQWPSLETPLFCRLHHSLDPKGAKHQAKVGLSKNEQTQLRLPSDQVRACEICKIRSRRLANWLARLLSSFVPEGELDPVA